MKLHEWLKSTGITQAEFAKRINVSQGRIAQVSKSGTDSLSLAKRIMAETNGEIGIFDLCLAHDQQKRGKHD